MNSSRRAVLTEGAISPLLIRLTLPMIIGMLSMTIFNLVDTFYIGHLGKDELAAMSFTFPVVMVINSLSVGLGMGAASVISRAIGRGDTYTTKRTASDALLLALCIVCPIVVIGEFTINPLFTLLGADSTLLPMIREYMRIWYIGAVFVVVPMTGNNIIRATGDMKTPGIIMSVSAGINILLDPFLIFGLWIFPQMGIAGAALATVLARAFSMFFSLAIIIFRENLLTLQFPKPRDIFKSWGKILFVGVPAAMTNLITPLSMGFITRLVAGYGNSAVAGFGVATRLEMLVIMLINALGSVLIPFSGQNLGAGKKERIAKALSLSYIFCALWSGVIFIVFFFLGRPIAGLFNDHPEVVGTAALYMAIVSLSYSGQGIVLTTAASLNGMNKPLHSTTIALIRLFVLYVPLAYLGSRLFELKGIFGAAFIANILSAGIAFLFIRKQVKFR